MAGQLVQQANIFWQLQNPSKFYYSCDELLFSSFLHFACYYRYQIFERLTDYHRPPKRAPPSPLGTRPKTRKGGSAEFVHNGWSTQHTLKPRSVESWRIKQLLWFFSLSATIFSSVEGFRALSKMNPYKSWYLAVIVKNNGEQSSMTGSFTATWVQTCEVCLPERAASHQRPSNVTSF